MKSFPNIPKTELYLVGGCVRDHLLSVSVKDRDFVAITKLSFVDFVSEIMKIGEVFMVKKEFLTVRCKIDNEVIDIAYPRVESDYNDGRHPSKVSSTQSLKEDASRRDFTINAMFMDKYGNILDFFKGQNDLKRGTIKTVRNPDLRFQEDYLRILRAVRFSVKLKFRIDIKTWDAMVSNAYKLDGISSERIKDELNASLRYNQWETIENIEELGIKDLLNLKGLRFELTSKQ